MNGVLWGAAGLLAAAFLLVGVTKLLQPRDKLIAGQMAWAEDFSASTVKTIGLLEVLAAIGLIVPPLVGVASWLAPIAAVCLIGLMIGAFYTHIRRDESHFLLLNAVLLVLSILVAWGRFGPYPFSA